MARRRPRQKERRRGSGRAQARWACQRRETAELLRDAKSVIIVPGYGMAVAQAQHTVNEITKTLRDKGVQVRFAIHPWPAACPAT